MSTEGIHQQGSHAGGNVPKDAGSTPGEISEHNQSYMQLSRMRQFNSELDRLMREQFYSSKTPEQFLVEATRTASLALGVQRVSVWIYTEDRQAIRCACLFDGTHQPDSSGTLLQQQDFPAYFEAISQSRVVTADDAQTDPRTSEFTEIYLDPLNIHSMIDAHIPSASGVRGVLCCENVGARRVWAIDEASFAASLAELVGLALERAERSRTQEQLADALRAAERAGEAKSAFLANMSHEIRTPMNGILGMLELSLLDEQDQTKRGQLEIAHTSARSLLNVLDDILDHSRLEAGELTITSEPYELEKIVAEVTSLFHSRAEAKGLAIRTDIDPSVPEIIIGDPSRMRQVLSNFVSNALKFTDEGQVEVAVLSDSSDHKPYVRIEVRDTGIGVPKDALSELFQRFSQVDNSSTRRYGGTGLGLVICKQLVELMKGIIGVESTEGKGSIFWLKVPTEVAETLSVQSLADEDKDQTNSQQIPTRPLKVLAAEDNAVNQKVLKAMINSLGHDLVIVNNGQEALDEIDNQTFDILLMDIQMPVIDGINATRAIRARAGPERNIRIIALTANAMAGDRERYLATGMTDYLAKPFQRDQLARILNQVSVPTSNAPAPTPK